LTAICQESHRLRGWRQPPWSLINRALGKSKVHIGWRAPNQALNRANDPEGDATNDEAIDVQGSCSEDHVAQHDDYAGQIVRWQMAATGKIMKYGPHVHILVCRLGEIFEGNNNHRSYPPDGSGPIAFEMPKVATNYEEFISICAGGDYGAEGAVG
jgi:hypothetical protein